MITLVRHTVDQWLAQQMGSAGLQPASDTAPPEAQTSPRLSESQIHWLEVIKNDVALNGAFATDDPTAYLDAWQSVDSDEGVPLAVAKRVFGQDPKPFIEELNQALIA